MSLLSIPAISLATAATNAGVSIWLGPDNISRIAIQTRYTGTADGTFKVETSNDPRARCDHPDYSSSEWVDDTTTFGLTDPAGSAGEEMLEFDNVNFEFLRISYTHSSGTGALYVWVTGRG